MKEKLKTTILKMKNPAFWLIFLFLAVLIVPGIVWDELDKEFRSKKLLWENRAVREKPLFQIRRIQKYPRDFNEYYNDAFPFREYLVWTAKKIIGPLNNFFNTKVFIGKEGFFFYTDKSTRHGDESRDFTGGNLWREAQLNAIVRDMEYLGKELKKMGIEFCVTVSPNKMTVYDDKLSEKRHYLKADVTRAEALVACVKKKAPELKIVFPDRALKEARKKIHYPLFFHEDTHWNLLAGYVAVREILNVLPDAVKLPPLENARIVEAGEIVGGDLRTMLGGGNPGVYRYKKVELPGMEKVKITEHPDFHHRKSFNPAAPDKRKVWIYRDSFAEAMEPYFSAVFRDVNYFWNVPIRRIQFEKDRPDIVILQMVERSLGSLDEVDFETDRKARLEYFR